MKDCVKANLAKLLAIKSEKREKDIESYSC